MNKTIFYWALYDFANSLISANITLYFSQWLIIDNQVEDVWYSAAIAISTILLIITAPFFGTYSDRTQKRIALINPLTIIMALGTILIGLVGAVNLPQLQKIIIAVFLFMIVQYVFQLSLIFYDTLLATIAKGKNLGKISGFGDAFGNLGFIFGLFITYPFINGSITLFGHPGRIQAFIPAGIGFILLALPMMLSFKDKNLNIPNRDVIDYKQILGNLKSLLKNHNILWFLVGFYFISDAVLTINTFFPIYLQEVLNFTDFQKILATIEVLVFIITGGLVLGKLSDKLGYKKVIIVSTTLLIILFSIFPLLNNVNTIWYFLPIAGIFWGGFYAASRAFLTHISPPGKRGEFFSLYTIFRRFASVVGPMLWGISIFAFSSFGVNKYKISIYMLITLMIIGLLCLRKIKVPK